MPDEPRAPIVTVRGRTRTTVVSRGSGLGDLPSVPPPTDGNPFAATPNPDDTNRLSSPAVQRTQTYNGANGVVPWMLGGPLPSGASIIFRKLQNDRLYVDFALGEGPTEAIGNITIAKKPYADLGITAEVHLGVAGDTTSALISTIEPTYTIPEYIAHVAMMIPGPTEASGDFNPLDFLCDWSGMKEYDSRSAVTAFSTNPIHHVWAMFTNDRSGLGAPSAILDEPSLELMMDGCDTDIDPTATVTKRWECSMRIDQQSSFEDWVNQVLAHCAGHLFYNNGKWGGYLDLPRSRAVDESAVAIVLNDNDPDTANVVSEPKVHYKGPSEKPTVVVINYYDAATKTDTSVMVPEDGPTPGLEFIVKEFTLRGITTIERARRMGTYLFNFLQLGKEASVKSWPVGLALMIGDRFGFNSRKLIPLAEVPPNAGAVAGVEEVVLVDAKLAENLSLDLVLGLYREATYGDLIDLTAPPTPPTPPDPNAVPDDPTGLVALSGTEEDYGVIEFFDAATPFQDYYEVLDTYGDPANPTVLGRVERTGPRTPAGKLTARFAQGIHGTVSAGRHFKVKVRTVAFPSKLKSPGVTASWDVAGEAMRRTKRVYADAVSRMRGIATNNSFAVDYNPAAGWFNLRTTTNVGTRAGFDGEASMSVIGMKVAEGDGFRWMIDRALIRFDTDEPDLLPLDAVIVGGRIGMYVDDFAIFDYVLHAQNTTAVIGAVSMPSDWINYGSGGDFGSIAGATGDVTGYKKIELNAAGYATITTLGKTKFAILGDDDALNNDPVAYSQAIFDATILANPGPYLDIIYTSDSEDALGGAPDANAVALQTLTPGTQQTGHANISGTMIAGEFVGHLTGDVTGNADTAGDGLSSAVGTLPLTLSLAAKALTGNVVITTTNDGGAVVKQAATPGTQQAGNLNISGAALAGSADISGPLDVGGNATVTGDLTVETDATVDGATTLSGTLSVAAAATLSSTLLVADDSELLGDVNIGQNNPSILSLFLGATTGENISFRHSFEVLTVAAAATSDTVADLIPESALVLAVSCRVIAGIPTATSFTLESLTDGIVFTAPVSVPAGSFDRGVVHWAVPNRILSSAAQKIRLRITGSNPADNSGRVRIAAYYIVSTPPTDDTTAALTGVAATGAVGTVTAFAESNLALTGVQATGAIAEGLLFTVSPAVAQSGQWTWFKLNGGTWPNRFVTDLGNVGQGGLVKCLQTHNAGPNWSCQRAYLTFDTTDSIPAGRTLLSARLLLTLSSRQSDNDLSFHVVPLPGGLVVDGYDNYDFTNVLASQNILAAPTGDLAIVLPLDNYFVTDVFDNAGESSLGLIVDGDLNDVSPPSPSTDWFIASIAAGKLQLELTYW